MARDFNAMDDYHRRLAEGAAEAPEPSAAVGPRPPSSDEPATVLAMGTQDKWLVAVIGAALGVGVGFLLPWLGTVAARYPIPFAGPIEHLSSFEAPELMVLRPVIGALVGLVVAAVVISGSPRITVSGAEIRIVKGDDERRIERAQVAGVYREGSALMIDSVEGRQLYKGDVEAPRVKVRDAFVAHGYPWEMVDAKG
ncbi:hypothetical protein EXU48_01540 [Occultella glacieicola]|uniref:YqeB PH domain-containing protein n=1 Tax=Occultella glacieicola TaxID=2518684 RepID=A0ABY2E8R4_9MICO|nr:hypothetical protein [Occultella glacieicola]TDE98906.1 hypothetical protein EXU48_01540 [Occultella glacieicola]